MALPPTIPTSFVPHSASSPTRRFRSDFTSAFDFFAYGVLGVIFLIAIGVFFYGRVLANDKTTKDAQLAKAEAAIDPATVEGFVKLRNRLNFGSDLLKKHISFSAFFTTLGSLLPSNVRFVGLHVSLDSAGSPTIEGSGVAKSFNTLAALSTAFANDGRIKDAIFSKISINKDNTVSFGLTATLDPKLVAFSPDQNVQQTVTQPAPQPQPQSQPQQPAQPGALNSLNAPGAPAATTP